MPFTPSVTNCHTFSDPLLPSSVTYFMDGPFVENKFLLRRNGILPGAQAP